MGVNNRFIRDVLDEQCDDYLEEEEEAATTKITEAEAPGKGEMVTTDINTTTGSSFGGVTGRRWAWYARKKPRLAVQGPKRGGTIATADTAVGKTQNVNRRVYCKEFPCIDARIHDLHMNVLLDGDESAEEQIGMLVQTCATLKRMGSVSNIVHTGDSRSSVAKMIISCTCGDPTHDMCIEKPGYSVQFPNMRHPAHVSWIGKRKAAASSASNQPRITTRRDAKFRGRSFALRRAAELQASTQQASSVVPIVKISVRDVIRGGGPGISCFMDLPDTSWLLRSVLQKRFFTPQLMKHQRACIRELEDYARREPDHYHRGGGGTANKIIYGGEHVCSLIIQDSILCLKRCKKTLRGPAFPSTATEEEFDTCIRVMHGTLLMLYPLGSKRPIFTARVSLAGRLWDLLMSTAEEKRAFVESHVSLVKICFVEHVVNLLREISPCESDLLLSKIPAMSVFEGLVVSMCDGFRQDILVTGEEDWTELDSVASSKIDRCMRICRLKMAKTPDPICRVCINPQDFTPRALEMVSTYGDTFACSRVYPSRPEKEVSIACKIQTCISCLPLPSRLKEIQYEALEHLHGGCFRKLYSAHNLTLCILCAINGKGMRSKTRMCSITGEISCDSCPPGTVISINMLGIILKICSTSYYMCPCCTKIQVWRGDGMDLHPNMQVQTPDERHAQRLAAYDPEGPCKCRSSTILQTSSRTNEIHVSTESGISTISPSSQTAAHAQSCMVCGAKNTSGKVSMVLPDVHRKILVRCYLCVRHSLPENVIRNITNTIELSKALHSIHVVSRQFGGRFKRVIVGR